MVQDCDLIGHVRVSDALSDVVKGIARLTSSENIGYTSHISKIVRHCAFLPQYLDTLSHVTVEDCAYFEHVDNFRHLDLIVLIFRLLHTSSLLVDHIGFCTDESVLMLTLPAFALVPRYEVRPCMLALYFLGETSKVFRLVKTSKVFARKHRRCFR